MLSLPSKSSVQVQSSKKLPGSQVDTKAYLRELLKEFPNYPKKDLKLVLELCEYDFSVAQSYLESTPKSKVRNVINSFLQGEIKPGQISLGVSSKKKDLEDSKIDLEEVKESKAVEYGPIGPDYFELKLTTLAIHKILEFLDPTSLVRAGMTCKRLHEVSSHPHHYKKFCKKLYLQYPRLPKNTPFNLLVQEINTTMQGEFPPTLVVQANEDIRSLIWLPEMKAYYTPTSFYKQFGNMKGIFLNAPRLRFAGVYMMKEKYIRQGEKDLTSYYDPFHIVEFYRYFRFFPDGLVMSSLSIKKLKEEKIAQIFSANSQFLEENNELYTKNSIQSVLKGEYVVQKSCVHIRLNAKSTIYEFKLEIGSSSPGCFDQLTMTSQNVRILGSDHSQPIQNTYMETKMFKFVKVKALIQDLDENLRNIVS